MKLFKENGEIANFEDIAKFMVETYPPDVFISGENRIQKAIFRVRDECITLLKELKEWREKEGKKKNE